MFLIALFFIIISNLHRQAISCKYIIRSMIIKDNMANMCAKVTSTYMEFTLAFGPKLEFSFSFKFDELDELDAQIFYSKKEHMFTSGTICAKI